MLANLFLGSGMAFVALLYRRPRLLAAWATVQGIALVSFPAWWSGLSRGYISSSDLFPMLGVTLGLPVIYSVVGAVLGLRLPHGWWRGPLLGLPGGVLLLGWQAWNYGELLRQQSPGYDGAWDCWLLSVGALTLTFAALLLPLPFVAGAVLRRTDDAPARRFPHEAVLIGLALMLFNPPHLEPLATGLGSRIQPGGSPWLPSATLAVADVNGLTALLNPVALGLVWLALPYGLILAGVGLWHLAHHWRTLRLPGYPAVLAWAGLAWLGLFVGEANSLRFPTDAVTGTSGYNPFGVLLTGWLPLISAAALLLAARAAVRPWPRRVIAVGRTAILGGLLWLAGLAAWLLWDLAHVFSLPWPDWVVHHPYQTLPTWAALLFTGLVRGGFAEVIGWVGWQTLAAWGRTPGGPGWDANRLIARLTVPAGALVTLAALGWWATTPVVVRQLPLPDATDVPVDTHIWVQTPAEPQVLQWLLGYSGGSGLEVRYADDPPAANYIQGDRAGDMYTRTFQPSAPLRPNARIAVRVSHAGVRDTVSYFTTSPAAAPSATPLPYPTGWPTIAGPARLPPATLVPPVPTAVPPLP